MSEETNDPSVADRTELNTGVPAIDDAIKAMATLDSLEVNDHPQAYDAIHGVLREVLAHAGRPEDPPVDP